VSICSARNAERRQKKNDTSETSSYVKKKVLGNKEEMKYFHFLNCERSLVKAIIVTM
jgi:hypothetical protein